jgi:hypothetical protein
VVSVSEEDGKCKILSDAEIPNSENPFDVPVALAVDEAGESALVVDQGLGSLMTIDFADDEREILSNPTTPDELNPLIVPTYIALDLADGRNRALVTDQNLEALVAVDLDSGSRMILSDSQTPDAENVFALPGAVAVDEAGKLALVVDLDLLAVLTVDLDLEAGKREVLSDPDTPDEKNRFVTPSGIFIDLPNNRALVVDGSLAAVIAVDLDDGARTVLSDATTGAGSKLVTPISITAGFAADQVLVLDQALGAVFVVSGTDGDRVIMSR